MNFLFQWISQFLARRIQRYWRHLQVPDFCWRRKGITSPKYKKLVSSLFCLLYTSACLYIFKLHNNNLYQSTICAVFKPLTCKEFSLKCWQDIMLGYRHKHDQCPQKIKWDYYEFYFLNFFANKSHLFF